MFLIINLISLLASDILLTRAFGVSTLFIAAEDKGRFNHICLTVIFFTTSGSAAAYLINELFSGRYADLRLFFYILAVGILYIILLAVLYFADGKRFDTRKKYVHLSALSCAVMGTLCTVSETAPEETLWGYVRAGYAAGVGFMFSAFILTAAYRWLNSEDVPQAFRGEPAMLVYLGIISMAVYALT